MAFNIGTKSSEQYYSKILQWIDDCVNNDFVGTVNNCIVL